MSPDQPGTAITAEELSIFLACWVVGAPRDDVEKLASLAFPFLSKSLAYEHLAEYRAFIGLVATSRGISEWELSGIVIKKIAERHTGGENDGN